MKHSLLVVLATATILAVVGCAKKNDVTGLAANAESGFYITGTLAALGSFEWDEAPLANDAAIELHNVAVAYKEGRVDKDLSQKRVNAIEHAKSLLDQALAACAQDGHTAKCTKDEAAGRALLDQARAALSTLP